MVHERSEELSEADPLERRPTRSLVEELHRDGLIGDAARAELLEALAAESEWWPPLSRLLATLGTASCLAGLLFFFAANWEELSRFEKLGLALLPLLLSLGLALTCPLDSLRGRLSLCAATVCTGIVLAVFGQVYQTGADAWQLFATWAALTAGWMALSRFAGHVLVWLAVAQVALATAWVQELHPGSRDFPAGLGIALAALSFSALAAFDSLARAGEGWADSAWSRRLLLAAGLGELVLPACLWIASPDDITRAGPVAGLLAVAAIAASWLVHRQFRPDLPALALSSVGGLCVLLTLVGKPLFEASDDWPALLLFGLLVSAAVAGAVSLLRREQRAMSGAGT